MVGIIRACTTNSDKHGSVTADLFKTRKLWQNARVLNVQAIFHDGSGGQEFMTDDIAEAQEIRDKIGWPCGKPYVIDHGVGRGELANLK